ncbi:Rpn family recombination-promoting nuclease/putative transposase [Salicibibacter kimchii]|nr:Rpn family recombination-promoting nuclease/putative transposase [Salicibibacter kimchii]
MRPKLLKRLSLDRLMDLKVDYAFKQLFGSEKNKEITVVFLNAVLQRNEHHRIKEISFANVEKSADYEEDKESRLDIVAVTDANEWINIEIQFTNKYDMVKRSLYYWSGLYQKQLTRRMSYTRLQPVIAINIMNFDLFKEMGRFHTSYRLYEDHDKTLLTDVMEFHFLEMPKLLRDWKENKLDPWNDTLARWLLLLGIVDHRKNKVYEDIYKELEEIAMEDENLRNAFQDWETLSASQEEWLAYEGRLKRVLDDESARIDMENLEKEARKARQEGEKARQEGEKEGRQEGRQLGRQEEVVESTIMFLKVKFPEYSMDAVSEKMKAIENLESLKKLQQELAQAKTWTEVEELLEM